MEQGRARFSITFICIYSNECITCYNLKKNLKMFSFMGIPKLPHESRISESIWLYLCMTLAWYIWALGLHGCDFITEPVHVQPSVCI